MNNNTGTITSMATDRSHKIRFVMEFNTSEVPDKLKGLAILGGYGTAKNAILEALYKEMPELRNAIDNERGSAYVRRPKGSILDIIKDAEERRNG